MQKKKKKRKTPFVFTLIPHFRFQGAECVIHLSDEPFLTLGASVSPLTVICSILGTACGNGASLTKALGMETAREGWEGWKLSRLVNY